MISYEVIFYNKDMEKVERYEYHNLPKYDKLVAYGKTQGYKRIKVLEVSVLKSEDIGQIIKQRFHKEDKMKIGKFEIDDTVLIFIVMVIAMIAIAIINK